MFENAKKLLSAMKASLLAGLVHSIPLFIIVVGVTSMIAPSVIGMLKIELHPLITDYIPINTILPAFGTALVSGGAFTAMLKWIQFTGVFKKALSDIVFGRELLQARKDLEPIWRNISEEMSERRFPQLSDELSDMVLEHYFPTRKNYYFSRHIREVDIFWEDRDARKIALQQHVEATLVPHAGKEINYRFSYKASSLEDFSFDDLDITIDRKPIHSWNPTLSTPTAASEDGYFLFTLSVTFPGGQPRHLVRKSRAILSLNERPYLKIPSGTHMKNCSVYAHCHAKNLRTMIEPMGTIKNFHAFGAAGDPRSPRPNNATVEYPGLILPGQGYILIFNELADDSLPLDSVAASA